MKDILRRHTGAALLVALFVLLATLYSLVSPIFEVSDEFLHYPVVQHIATTGQLPVQRPGIRTMWDQEGSQPPLYYLVGAAATFWINTDDLSEVRWLNPHAKLGVPLDPNNKNIIIHTDREAFPWHGTVLAVHLIRFLSVAMCAAGVALTYATVHAIWPDRRRVALLATALVAFNPMFLFITGSVNNDNLMMPLGAWVLYLVVRVLKDGLTARRAVVLALAFALGALTKLSGLSLAPVIGLALLLHGARTKEWRKVTLAGLGIVIAWAVVAGWWYVRNLRLYGELLGTGTMIAIAGPREVPITLWELRREWYGFWVAYWALFGGVSILADQIVYRFYAVISWVAVAGLVWWVVRRVRAKEWDDLLIGGLLALQVLLTFASLLRWTLMTYGSQGRLMFPVIGAISTLMALGLLNWIPDLWGLIRRTRSQMGENGSIRVQMAAMVLVGVPLLVIAVIAPFRYIAPAYARPPVVSEVPEWATPIGVNYNGLEIVALATDPAAVVEAGGRVEVTLYLRANRPPDTNYSVYLRTLGRNFETIGRIDSYPGGGSLPATFMEVGAIYEDTYSIELASDFPAPTMIRIATGIGLWEPPDYTVLTGHAVDGTERSTVIVEGGTAYPEGYEGCTELVPDDVAVSATVGGFAQLWAAPLASAYRAGDTMPVTLYWDRLADPGINWTVFVHLVDGSGEVVAQADGPPLNGDYPTSRWRAACQFEDVHPLVLASDLRAGEYTVLVGMYNADDPAYARAPAAALDGTIYPDFAVPVATIEVQSP